MWNLLYRPWVRAIVFLLGGAVATYLLLPTKVDPTAYAATILEYRREKDNSMRQGPDSPFGDAAANFDSLDYYAPDIRFRVKAKLEPIEKKQVRILETSSGEQVKYLEFAWAVFLIGREMNRLLILEVMDMGPSRGKLFLAFADETSGRETYGAGRYLDLKKVPAATSIELDFNKAYNPYCAYNDAYSCPFPPQENILKVPILAGEKAFKQH